LRLGFDDGVVGDVDVGEIVPFEGVFAELVEPEVFGEARLDPEVGTVVWPGGADLDPLVLYSSITGIPVEEILRRPVDDRTPRDAAAVNDRPAGE